MKQLVEVVEPVVLEVKEFQLEELEGQERLII